MLPTRNGPLRQGGGGTVTGGGLPESILPPRHVQARLLLFLACVWPLFVMTFIGSSSIDPNSSTGGGNDPNALVRNQRLSLRTLMDRVDIMGYGPTHPRVAFIVMGEETEGMKDTVKSIFQFTDLNRIFLITTVIDGMEEDKTLMEELKQMDEGTIPHWHGMRPDIHLVEAIGNHQHIVDEHGRKVHTIFHTERRGMTAARIHAVEFVKLLEEKHLKAGLKSPDEDLIVVFLRAGVELMDQSWLPAVTNALIIPPPLIKPRKDDPTIILKLSNAVSLRLEDSGKVTSFDEKFMPIIEGTAKTSDINSSSGQSYGTPTFNGGGIAMRLDTFLHLPSQDVSLMDAWPANLDLALNLWLCGDGIDILQDAQVTSSSSWMNSFPIVPLDPQLAARFAAVWMEERIQSKFFQAYSNIITRLDWETKVRQAKQSSTFPKGNLAKRCRPFEWYINEVNSDLSKILEQPGYDTEISAGGGGGGTIKTDTTVADGAHGTAAATDKGMVKKRDMERVVAAIADHNAREEIVAVENPNIRANQELAQKQEEDQKTIPKENPMDPPPPIKEDAVVPPTTKKEEVIPKENHMDPPSVKEEAVIPAKKDDVISKENPKDSPPIDSAAAAKKDETISKENHNESPPINATPAKKEDVVPKENLDQPPSTDAPVPAKKAESQNEPPPVDGAPSKQAQVPTADVTGLKPKAPLRPTNLKIIQQATPMEISYLAVDGGHKDHPHLGAKDEEGNRDYVHDEKALHKNPPPFTWSSAQEEQEACSLRDDDFRMLTERVSVDTEYDKKMKDSGAKRDKIFCLVYTIEKGHPSIPNIRQTWGSKCDGFMVGSTKTDKSIGAVEIPHEGEEAYDNIWQKVRSMWSYIYDNYYKEYDWFHIGGDDLFLLVENLRLYLESEEIRTAANGGVYLPFGNETKQTPLFLGRRFRYLGNDEEIFNSGGSGYTMNKAALKLLVTEGFPNYFPHAHTFSEDTMVATIFRKLGVFAYDTKDEDGGERYMPFMPGDHWSYQLPKEPTDDWYAKYSIDIKEGPEHCSPRSLAFHYVKGESMKRLFALAYGLCSEKYIQHPAKQVLVPAPVPPPVPATVPPPVPAPAPAVDTRPIPKVPLRRTNLNIVQQPDPVDISYVAVDGGHKDHPHLGAKDEEGNWGYIHDEKALSRNPLPFAWPTEEEQKACSSRDQNFRMLTERVSVDMEYDKKMRDSGAKRDKIFCLVYTIETGHPRIPSIRETWGSKCDGFMVGSTKTDKSIGAVEIPHEGEEAYDNIWQKVRSMWSYIYDNYYKEYDWFHIGGDDLFLLVENLRLYLESEEIRTAANGGIYLPFGNETKQTPLFLGRRFRYLGHDDEIFNSGGSGYTMNKAALKLLVTEGFPNYFPHAHTFSEDTMVAKIFKKFRVFPYDTKDEDGGERYMPFMPGHHWGYRLPKDPSKDWYAKYSIDIKEGPEHCSPRSLAFHYVKDTSMKRLFALSYGLCSDKYMQK